MGFQQVKLFNFRCVVKRDPPSAGFEPSPARRGAFAGLHLNDGEHALAGKPPGLGVVRSRSGSDIQIRDADLYEEQASAAVVFDV